MQFAVALQNTSLFCVIVRIVRSRLLYHVFQMLSRLSYAAVRYLNFVYHSNVLVNSSCFYYLLILLYFTKYSIIANVCFFPTSSNIILHANSYVFILRSTHFIICITFFVLSCPYIINEVLYFDMLFTPLYNLCYEIFFYFL